VLEWTVSRLSTGERQRLALARLLALQPQVLLLDEATANLDPPNRDRVEDLIQDYRREQGAAVLWVSHDPDQRRRLTRPAPGLPGARRLVIQGDRLVDEPEEPDA
jgi:putative ABC transport system ATP-binding protein